MAVSSGLIIYRKKNEDVEFFVGHPGGPFWKNNSSYYFLKGGVEKGEDLLTTAIREVREECGKAVPTWVKENKPHEIAYLYLGSVKQSRKTVHAFLIEDDFDENECYSNKCEIEYPLKSGNMVEVPEIDDYKWMTYEKLAEITHPKHLPLYQKALSYIHGNTMDK